MNLRTPDDVLPRAFDGIVPATQFERRLLEGPVTVRVDQVRLAHDVLRLCRAASHVAIDEKHAVRYPAERIWGLSILKVKDHLARTLGAAFTTQFDTLTWKNTFSDLRTACEASADDAMVDIAPRIRNSIEGSLRITSVANDAAPTFRDAAWTNFQANMRALAPIFAGEVTRADLSA